MIVLKRLNREMETAREAGGKIRDWLREEKQSRKSPPRVSIKFCGGCNPVTDRGLLARKIREILGASVDWVPWEEKGDLAILLNGCETACAERAEVRKNARALLEIQGYSVSGVEATHGASGGNIRDGGRDE